MQWWESIVRLAATRAASKPLVQTEIGLLPALPDQGGQFATFVVPAIDSDASESIDYDTFHEVVGYVTELNLPSKEVAETWGEIARQWHRAGVEVDRLGLKEFTNWLKDRANAIGDLPINADSYSWLAKLFLLAAEMKDQNVRNMVNGLLPNQHGEFTDTKANPLFSDGGIPLEIKEIASVLGEDLRSRLLHNAMAQALKAQGYDMANQLAHSLLHESEGGEYTESKAIDLILDQLASALPNDSQFDGNTGPSALAASARMVVHLGRNEDVLRLRRCPLLTAAGRVAHLQEVSRSWRRYYFGLKLHAPMPTSTRATAYSLTATAMTT